MSEDKTPVQADGDGRPAATPQGHAIDGAGESGGGAYTDAHVQDGDNRERERPVKTGQEPER